MSFACVVCLEDYVNRSKERIVWSRKCGHIFHHGCLSRWLATCRQKRQLENCPKCGMAISMKTDVQVLYDEGEKEPPAKRTLPRQHPAQVMGNMEVTTTSPEAGSGDGGMDAANDVDMDGGDWSPDAKRGKY